MEPSSTGDTSFARDAHRVDEVQVDKLKELVKAIAHDQNDIVNLLITRGVDVNGTVDRLTPLSLACQRGNCDVVKLLLKHGAVCTGDQSMEPLVMACRTQHLEVVDILIGNGASVNARGFKGETPLYTCVSEKLSACVFRLLERGADLNVPSEIGRFPLHVSIENSDDVTAQFLIQFGADPNAVEATSGMCPLHVAARFGTAKIAALLLDSGAHVDPRDAENCTPLWVCAKYGNVDVANILVERGADVNAFDSVNGTPLHSAVCEVHVDMVKKLIASGATVNTRREQGITPLMSAAKRNEEIVRLLLCAGAEVRATTTVDHVTTTALQLAILGDQTETACLLIDSGADVNSPDPGVMSPLHVATAQRNLRVVNALIEKGADVNAAGHAIIGCTPIMTAVQQGLLDVARALIEHGADVNVSVGDGQFTLLMFCIALKNYDMAQLLLTSGADTSRTVNGLTALELATCLGDQHMTRLIMESANWKGNGNKHSDKPRQFLEGCKSGLCDVILELLNDGVGVNSTDENGASGMMLAARYGHLDVATALIQRHAAVHLRDVNGSTALHVAAENGHTTVAVVILGAGASIDIRDNNDVTPLFAASRQGHLETVRELIRHGADVNARNNANYSTLCVAAFNGHDEIISALIGSGAEVNARQPGGSTPLMIASKQGLVRTVRMLLENGAFADNFDDDGRTSVWHAAADDLVEVVKMLTDHGADTSIGDLEFVTPLNVALKKGHTTVVQELRRRYESTVCADDDVETLCFAAETGDMQILSSLINSGVDINLRSRKSNGTALIIASEHNRVEVAIKLIESGAEVNAGNSTGRTPLWYAAVNGCVKIVDALLATGASVNSCTNDESTPLVVAAEKGNCEIVKKLMPTAKRTHRQIALYWASASGHVQVVKFLLECGLDVDCSVSGLRPLQIAAQNGHHDVIGALLERHADVNSVDSNNITPLVAATKNGHAQAVRILLDHGADFNIEDSDGMTPLAAACELGHLEVVRHLLVHGAPVESADRRGRRPLWLAASNGHCEVINVLLEHGADLNACDDAGITPMTASALNKHIESTCFILKEGGQQFNISSSAPRIADSVPSSEILSALKFADDAGLTDLGDLENAEDSVVIEVTSSILTGGGSVNRCLNEGNTLLHFAAFSGNVEAALVLLQHGASVNDNGQRADGIGPLAVACIKKHSQLVDVLLEHGADPNAMDAENMTPLMHAVRHQSLDVVDCLIKHGADVNTYAGLECKLPVLYYAAASGNTQIVAALLRSGADCNARVRHVDDGMTSLHVACIGGHLEVVSQLIAAGANVNVKCSAGYTPLWHAIVHGFRDITSVLLNNGSDVNAQPFLHVAIVQGHEDIVRTLLDADADMEVRDNSGWTPLWAAVAADRPDIALLLMERGANVNVKCHYDKYDWTLLTLTLIEPGVNFRRIVFDLLVHGAEVNARSFEDITALMCACHAGDEDIVLALLNCGATLDDVDVRGQTALNWAVSHCSIIQLLLDHGATVDQRPNCVPPLFSAVESGNTDSARLLLQCGADVNERFSDGRQPLHVACDSAKIDIVNLLLDHGASINDTALGFGTPLFFAISKQHVHLVSLLLERGANASKPAKDDDSMMTPLKLAVLIGNDETVRLLLHSKSLDQNDISLALMQVFCSARGNVQVLRLLLESCNEKFVKAALPVAVSTSVRNNDGATLEILLNLSDDVCIADYFSKYCNVIFTAADNGQTDVIRIFIRRGVNTDVRNVDGKSPLIMAAARGHLETVKLLVENDADVFATDDGGKSALQHASYNGHTDVVTYLSHYHRYVRPVDSRHNSSTKQSNPLFEVNDVAEAERLIIQENIDIECENLHGSRPLHFAARRGHVDLVRLLLECGATSDAADFNGHTPLHEAAGHSLNVVEMLLRYTKRINVQNTHGRTPLHEAVQNKRYDIALYLLECGADAGVTDDWMNTALQYAASQDWFSMSPLFDRLSAHSSSAWAKPNVIGISARQRLRLIAECLRAEDKTVVYQRSNTRNADDLHNTELHRVVGAYGASKLFAVCSDPNEAVALLLKSPGADMNVRNIYGQTPLHVCRSYEAVKACLQHDPAAALTATDKRGRNIWHLLAVRGNAQQFVDIIEQLVPDVGNYGLDAVDALGRTPLHYSVTRSVNRYFSRWLVNKVSHCQNVTDWYGRTPSQYYTSLMDQTGAEGTTKEKDITSIVDDMSFLEKYQLTYFDYFQYNLATITANKFQENHFRVSRNVLLSGFDEVLSCLRESRHQQLSLREADDENWFILELYRKHFYTYTERSEILEDAPLSPRAQTNDGISKLDSNSSQMYHGRQMFKSISEIVTQAMSSLIRAIAKIDQRFSGRLVPAGSVFEETKIDFCDEFDFIVELEQFGKMCTVVESPCSPAGFVFISSASHAQNANFAEFFDGNSGLLNTRLVKFRFETLVRRVLSEARFQMENDFLEVIEIIRGESVLYSFYPDRLATNIKMKFMKPVNGQHVFHEVSIDIVPAITIENYWPSNAVQDIVGQLRHFIESVPAPRCFLVFDQPQKKHPWTGWTPPHARVDFSVFESEIIRACPLVVRAACIVVKQIVKNFCNFRFFKSYVIKAALMHSIITSSADNCRSDSASADRSQDVHQLVSWVQRIMRRLLCFALQDFVPSVFLPGFVLPVCSFETHVKFSHVRLHQSGIAYDDVIRSELLLGDNTNKMVDSQFEHIIKAYVGSHLMYWSVLPNAVTRQLFFPPINPVFEEDYWSLMHCETKFPLDSSI